MFLAPHVLSKPSSKAIAEKLLILICIITRFHAALAYMMSSSQNVVFDLGLMSLFVVEDCVITFNPNGPQGDAMKKVPHFNLFAFKESLFYHKRK